MLTLTDNILGYIILDADGSYRYGYREGYTGQGNGHIVVQDDDAYRMGYLDGEGDKALEQHSEAADALTRFYEAYRNYSALYEPVVIPNPVDFEIRTTNHSFTNGIVTGITVV